MNYPTDQHVNNQAAQYMPRFGYIACSLQMIYGSSADLHTHMR